MELNPVESIKNLLALYETQGPISVFARATLSQTNLDHATTECLQDPF